MRKHLLVKIALGITLLVGNAGTALSAGQPLVAVNSGEGDVKSLQASVTINAPPQAVWETLTAYEDMKNFMPGYEKSKVVANRGTSKTVDIAHKVSRFLPAYNYQVNINENRSAYQVQISRVSGAFKSIQASYKLVPTANSAQTLLVYRLNIDLGGQVPNIGINKTLSSSAEQTLKALQAQSEAHYCKSRLTKR